MPEFMVAGRMTVSCWTKVEAETEAQALQIAAGRMVADSHIDGSYPVNESWHFENDGTPFELRVDED